MRVELDLPAGLVEEVAQRAAELVLERLGQASASSPESELVGVEEAAAFLRAKPQRVYDLLSAGRLTRHKDGARVLVSRAELRALVGLDGVAPALPRGARARMGAGVRA